MKRKISVAGREVLLVARPIHSKFSTRWEASNNYHEFRNRVTHATAKDALADEEVAVRSLFTLKAAI